MRSLTPTPPKHGSSIVATTTLREVGSPQKSRASFDSPVSACTAVASAATKSQESDMAVCLQSVSDTQAENTALKEELERLRTERQVILNHSIESDQRLLQYTEDIFLSPPSMTITDPVAPTHTVINADTQTDNSILAQLDKANRKILELERQLERLSRPCERCVILKEEADKMIVSLRCLEAENKSLHINIQDTRSKIGVLQDQNITPHLTVHNSFEALTRGCESDKDDIEGFTVVSNKRRNKQCAKPRGNTIQKHNIHKKQQPNQLKTRRPLTIPFRNITVVGDSHTRNLAKLMGDKIIGSTAISGVCKPGAGIMKMKPTVEPPRDHCYVLLAGTNDAKSEKEEVICGRLEEVLLTCRKSSEVLMVSIPTRYDLYPDSPVHRKVNRINTYMTELCRRYEGVGMVDTANIRRCHFTSHGLHLRNSGKRILAAQILRRLADLGVNRKARESQAGEAPPPPPTDDEHGTHASGETLVVNPQDNQSPEEPDALSFKTPSAASEVLCLPYDTFAEAVKRSTAATTGCLHTTKNDFPLESIEIG